LKNGVKAIRLARLQTLIATSTRQLGCFTARRHLSSHFPVAPARYSTGFYPLCHPVHRRRCRLASSTPWRALTEVKVSLLVWRLESATRVLGEAGTPDRAGSLLVVPGLLADATNMENHQLKLSKGFAVHL
jgi:hypothetical protein